MDVPTLLFLVLLIIVVYALLKQSCMPLLMLSLIGLWVSYQTTQQNYTKICQKIQDDRQSKTDSYIEPMADEPLESSITDKLDKLLNAKKEETKIDADEFDTNDQFKLARGLAKPVFDPYAFEPESVDVYIAQGKDIPDIHHYMGSRGDTQMCNRMKYMQMQPKLSQKNRADYNKYSLQPFLEEELQEHSEREWWNSDFLEDGF